MATAMTSRSISVSLEEALLQELDNALEQECANSDTLKRQNRSAALGEALQLWLEQRRLKALHSAYAQLAALQGGDLHAAEDDACAMAIETLH